MKILIFPLGGFYLLMAAWVLTIWLKFFKQDTSLSSEDRLLSMVILVIATILWPVVVPIAYLELLQEKIKDLDLPARSHSSNLRPLLISILMANLLNIFGLAAFAYLFAYQNY